jgi:methionyl-tRNA synthetase
MTPGLGFHFFASILLFAVLVWSIVWKGLALWKSARNDNNIWFVVFLVVNTMGILEILYLYVFSKKKSTPVLREQPPTEEKK